MRSTCTNLVNNVTFDILIWSNRFDLVNMKGSTVDAMSDAIDNAAVMLYGVSLACECIKYHCSAVLAQHSSTLTHCDMSGCADKESANCRLEASLQLVLDICDLDISVLDKSEIES
eukprot:COSAG02_NODE_5674_length_4138_cov_472.361228_2_plen_116_part_00